MKNNINRIVFCYYRLLLLLTFSLELRSLDRSTKIRFSLKNFLGLLITNEKFIKFIIYRLQKFIIYSRDFNEDS